MHSVLQQGVGKAPSVNRCVFVCVQKRSIIPFPVYVQQSETGAQPNKRGDAEIHVAVLGWCGKQGKGRGWGGGVWNDAVWIYSFNTPISICVCFAYSTYTLICLESHGKLALLPVLVYVWYVKDTPKNTLEHFSFLYRLHNTAIM